MSAVEELLARVKAATGPDRGLDQAFVDVFGKWSENGVPSCAGILGIGGFTYDLNAIVALIETEFPGCFWSTGRPVGASKRKRKPDNVKIPYDAFIATSDRIGEPEYSFALTEGPTPPLALCAAFLAAKIAVSKP